ncbi:UNVERIFIED_CONTAM: hypothetical protein PYX00_011730 [Menopon gallinae]|uniref:DNA-(apurinic or apyrimidinic site) lyase n=1 Tax=Menopon gallinae TaxID=328185 RepID=A0AAW2H912_9NEOP
MVLQLLHAHTMAWFLLESNEHIDLEKTLFSGQTFSFKKTGVNLYSGVLGGAIITFRQVGDAVHYNYHKNMQSELASFFTLSIGHEALVERWNRAQKCIRFEYRGLRLLRCDLLETIFSFICSSNNNIKRITKMVDYLFSKGDFLGSVGGHRFHSFPPVQRLADIEGELRERGFGYRAQYICKTARKLQETELGQNTSYAEVCKALMSLSGVGQKKRLDKQTRSVIKKRYLELFGSYAGIAQLFVFKDMLDRRMKSTGIVLEADAECPD